jgi:hypothetical protein
MSETGMLRIKLFDVCLALRETKWHAQQLLKNLSTRGCMEIQRCFGNLLKL